MMERETRHDDRERTVGERQDRHIADMPFDVAERERVCVFARLLDHRRSDIDPGRTAADLCKGRHNEARPASDVEHLSAGPAPENSTRRRNASSSRIAAALANGVAWRVN